jgi:hypothetical protein
MVGFMLRRPVCSLVSRELSLVRYVMMTAIALRITFTFMAHSYCLMFTPQAHRESSLAALSRRLQGSRVVSLGEIVEPSGREGIQAGILADPGTGASNAFNEPVFAYIVRVARH